MLHKQNRLPPYLIPYLLKKGRRFYSPLFNLIVLKNREPVSRFAFIVSLAFDKRAVRRNFLKRQLRAIIRLKINQIKGGRDIIFKVSRPIKKERIALLLRDEVEAALKKAKLLGG